MKYMGQTPTKLEIQEMINKLDSDGTGVLEFPEFLKLAQSIKNEDPLLFEVSNNLTEEEQEKVKEKFLLFDADGNGSINKQELGDVLRYMGQNPTEAEVQQMLLTLDKDGTNVLEFPDGFMINGQL